MNKRKRAGRVLLLGAVLAAAVSVRLALPSEEKEALQCIAHSLVTEEPLRIERSEAAPAAGEGKALEDSRGRQTGETKVQEGTQAAGAEQAYAQRERIEEDPALQAELTVFEEDRLDGRRSCVYPNGDTYEGEFLRGVKSGEGTYTFRDGSVYTGTWKDDQWNGQGRYVSSAGFLYEGAFLDGKKEGQGVYTFADGSVYTGSFAADMENGQGRYESSTGYVYEGGFADGVWNGRGTLAWPNGSVYTGDFVDGQKEGEGVEEYRDEEGDFLGRYEGSFRAGLREGFGTYTLADGTVLTGSWKGDAFLWEEE